MGTDRHSLGRILGIDQDRWYFSVLRIATDVFVILFRHFYHRQQHEKGLVVAEDMGCG
jgi:hypothetical protein